MKIVAAKKLLKANDQLAEENRTRFAAAQVCTVNVVGSPGCGKTTLLEALFTQFQGRLRPAVIEGDIAGSIDAERIDALGIPVVQINTEGACHLDANMIAAAMRDLDLAATDLLVIENVGNLVCTAGFDLGEQRHRAFEHQRRRRQDRQVSGHLPAVRRPGHHQDRSASVQQLQVARWTTCVT